MTTKILIFCIFAYSCSWKPIVIGCYRQAIDRHDDSHQYPETLAKGRLTESSPEIFMHHGLSWILHILRGRL